MFVGDAVLGQLNPEPMLNSLYQRQERERARLLKEQQDELNRQDELSKVVDASFNDKNYATGGPHDGLIRAKTAENRKKYLRMIRENPGIRLADLQYQVQNDMANLAGMSENVKAARKQIEDGSLMFKDQPGIDVNAIKKLALDRMIYKTDEKGNKILKEPDEIDPTFDYVGDAINSNKGLVINRTKILNDYMKGARDNGAEFMDEVVTDSRGKKTTWKVDAKMYNFQDFERDSKGNVIEIDGRPRIKTKTRRIDLGNGQMVEVLDDNIYMGMMETPQTKLLIESDFESWNRSQKTPLDENSEEAEIMKRKIAYDLLNVRPLKDKFTNKTEEDAWLAKQRSGVTVNVISPEDRAAKKTDSKFESSPISTITRALSHDPEVMSTGEESTDDKGNRMINIANVAGGVKIAKSGKEDVYADEVLIDPSKKGRLVVKYNGKDYKEYTGKAATDFIKRISELNGLSFDIANEKVKEPEISKEDEMKERIQSRKKKFNILNPFSWSK